MHTRETAAQLATKETRPADRGARVSRGGESAVRPSWLIRRRARARGARLSMFLFREPARPQGTDRA